MRLDTAGYSFSKSRSWFIVRILQETAPSRPLVWFALLTFRNRVQQEMSCFLECTHFEVRERFQLQCDASAFDFYRLVFCTQAHPDDVFVALPHMLLVDQPEVKVPLHAVVAFNNSFLAC